MTTRIRKNESRLLYADLVALDGKEFWDRPKLPDIPASTRDRYHTVEEHERIDSIAYFYYKTDGYWWVIAHVNNLRVLPDDLKPGMRIRIPDIVMVRKVLPKK